MVVFPQVKETWKGFAIPHPAIRFLPGACHPHPRSQFFMSSHFFSSVYLFIYLFLLLLFSVTGMQLEVLKG